MSIGGLLFAVGFLIWILSMRVAEAKSWEILNISKLSNAIYVLIMGGFGILLGIFVGPTGSRLSFDHLWIMPFAAGVYYLTYVLFAKRHRESWGELFRPDRWNGLVLASSIFVVTIALAFAKPEGPPVL